MKLTYLISHGYFDVINRNLSTVARFTTEAKADAFAKEHNDAHEGGLTVIAIAPKSTEKVAA